MISPQVGLASPQFWNSYAYCGNNPVRYLDPDGRSFLVFLGGPGIIFVFDRSGNQMGWFSASNKPGSPGATNYQTGYWDIVRYIAHLDAGRTDSIDDLGFFGFNAPADPYGSKGVHSGGYSFMDYTGGCIRTTREAMWAIHKLNFGGDPLTFLVVVWDSIIDSNGFIDYNGVLNSVAYELRNRGHDEDFISKVLNSIGGTLEDLFGCLNFIIDYWFNGDSPLPYEARY